MAAPFPEAQLEPLIYTSLGFLLSLVVVLAVKLRRLREEIQDDEPEIRVDRMGLSRRAEETLSTVLEHPELQSDLPEILSVSKATVSNAVTELAERGLIKRKKKANTYLIEPKIEKIREQQR